jgi:hypothetical protein
MPIPARACVCVREVRSSLGGLGAPARRRIALFLVLLTIGVYYVFAVTSGTFSEPSPSAFNVTGYYDLLAQGFQKGHLYVPVEPDPTLYESGDPFDTSLWERWLWDASLHNRHYYLYWGPVPAVCLLAFKWLSGSANVVLDQWPTLLFMIARLFGGAWIVYRYASRPETRQPGWAVAIAISVFGLANPGPFMLSRADIWEASLAGAQGFGMLGLAACYEGILSPRRRTPWLAAAGALFALAIGSRITFIVAVPLIIAITLGVLYARFGRSRRSAIRWALALTVPIALCLFAYGLYNHARFGSWTEFGVECQTTLQKFYTKSKFVRANLFSYSFASPDFSHEFPYIVAPRPRSLWHHMRWPKDYETHDPVTGLFVGTTFCVLLFFWIARPLWKLGAFVWRGGARMGAAMPAHELWLVLVSFALMSTCIPSLGLWEASMRYLVDPLAGATLASIVAFFHLLRRARSAPWLVGWAVRGIVTLLSAYTIVAGVCLAFTPYDERFERANPVLYERLKTKLSVCRLRSE